MQGDQGSIPCCAPNSLGESLSLSSLGFLAVQWGYYTALPVRREMVEIVRCSDTRIMGTIKVP